MEPSHYVINYYKILAAVFLLKLEDSHSLELSLKGVVGRAECHYLKSKSIV